MSDSGPIVDTLVFPIMEALLACVTEQLNQTLAGPPCFMGIVPGAFTPMDYCGCGGATCGMGYVRLDSIFPSKTLPQPILDANKCATPLAARFEVGAFRCIPVPVEGGENILMPTEADQAGAVSKQLSDMQAILRAVSCCMPGRDRALGNYTPIGPAGDCGGGSWQITYRIGV